MRRALQVVATVLLILLALSLPVGVMFYQASRARHDITTESARRADAIAVQACRSLNNYRAEDEAKWTYILKIAPPPPKGTPERDRMERFRSFLHISDAPKPC